MTRSIIVFVAVMLLSAPALVACGGSSQSSRETPPAETPAPTIVPISSPSPTRSIADSAATVPAVGANPIPPAGDVTIRASYSAAIAPDNPARPEAPEFSLSLHDGATFSLARHRGETVVMYFSFTRCGVCIPALKAVGQVRAEFGARGVSVIAINIDGRTTVEEWRAYWKGVGGSDVLWAVDDLRRTITVPYEVALHETIVIVDREGRIAFRDVVFEQPYETIRANLETVLQQSSTAVPNRAESAPVSSPVAAAPTSMPGAPAGAEPSATSISGTAGARRGGLAAPDFSLPTSDGSVFRLADQKGTRVLLYLAFIGCPSCGFMVPILGKIQSELGPGEIKVVAIDIFPDKLEAWEKYWRERDGGEVIWVVDDPRAPGGSVSKKYELTEAGTIVMIDREGQVANRHGFLPPSGNLYQQLLDEVRALP